MTVKEIALSVNKTERTIRSWIKKLAEESSVVKEKSSVSSPMNPSDYTLEETTLIIEKGLGKNAADIFRMSAEQNRDKNVQVPQQNIEALKLFGDAINIFSKAIEGMNNRLVMLESNSNQKQIGFEQDYYSIMGYCNLKSIKLDFSEAIKYGKEATKISGYFNKEIRKVPDERFGRVNSYHVDVLKKVFEV